MTSEKMNQIIPMRNDRSTCRLYTPCWFSPITVRNQPMNITASSARPAANTPGPNHSFSQAATPSMVVNSATEPMIGQGVPCGR
jgi:hypothetical protein